MIQLWMEGYSISGNDSKATSLGEYEAETLKRAAEMHAKASGSQVNLNDLTIWGCRLFDNEKDARKSFG